MKGSHLDTARDGDVFEDRQRCRSTEVGSVARKMQVRLALLLELAPPLSPESAPMMDTGQQDTRFLVLGFELAEKCRTRRVILVTLHN